MKAFIVSAPVKSAAPATLLVAAPAVKFPPARPEIIKYPAASVPAHVPETFTTRLITAVTPPLVIVSPSTNATVPFSNPKRSPREHNAQPAADDLYIAVAVPPALFLKAYLTPLYCHTPKMLPDPGTAAISALVASIAAKR